MCQDRVKYWWCSNGPLDLFTKYEMQIRLREVKRQAWCHPAKEWGSWELNLGLCGLRCFSSWIVTQMGMSSPALHPLLWLLPPPPGLQGPLRSSRACRSDSTPGTWAGRAVSVSQTSPHCSTPLKLTRQASLQNLYSLSVAELGLCLFPEFGFPAGLPPNYCCPTPNQASEWKNESVVWCFSSVIMCLTVRVETCEC